MKLNHGERIDVRGVVFDNVTLDEAAALTADHVAEGVGLAAVYTPNSEIVQACIDDVGELFDVINSAELTIPDGVGVVKASRILKTPLKCKVAGIELGEAVIKNAAEKGYRVYFLGGKPGIADTAAENMKIKYPGLNITGTADGYFKKSGEETDRVIDSVAVAGVDILFVCLGAPTQERWIYENRSAIENAGVKLALGLGGSLDVFAGNVKRAPKIFIKLGLEWFYRLLKEPSRIGRMMSLPKFYFGTVRYAHKRR